MRYGLSRLDAAFRYVLGAVASNEPRLLMRGKYHLP